MSGPDRGIDVTKRVEGLVSVIIPTLNRRGLLPYAVRSVLSQTYRKLEIVVVDDHSEIPVTLDIIEHPSSEIKISLIRNDRRRGGAASRNIGWLASAGEYVCFLDDDDIFYPEKIKRLFDLMSDDDHLDASFGKTRLVSGSRIVVDISYPDPFDPRLNASVFNLIHNNSTLIRSSVFPKCHYHDGLTRYQDMQFGLQVGFVLRTKFLDEYVAEWRVDDRPDKITAAGGYRKKVQDLKAFDELCRYLWRSTWMPKDLMAPYYARLIAQSIFLGRLDLMLWPTLKFVSAPRSWAFTVRALRDRRRALDSGKPT